MRRILHRKLATDQAGNSVTEFGLIAPAVFVMMLGTMDVGHSYYVRSTLDGVMQRAARSSSLEGATTFTAQELIDMRVKEAVRTLAPDAVITSTRRYYKSFSDAARADAEEVVEDPANADMSCDADLDETFWDMNNNGVWDEDGGDNGQGGARDIVIIKFKVAYPRLFPMAGLMGLPENVELESNSILANQPYGEQAQYETPDFPIPCPDA
jgi:Flp pilus assembly pilin Flp